MVACNKETKDFTCRVDEHVNVFGAVLGRLTHELDGLSQRLVIAEEKLAGLLLMVIDTLYEELSVEVVVGEHNRGQEVLIRDMARELIPIEESEPAVGDLLLLRFTRSLP